MPRNVTAMVKKDMSRRSGRPIAYTPSLAYGDPPKQSAVRGVISWDWMIFDFVLHSTVPPLWASIIKIEAYILFCISFDSSYNKSVYDGLWRTW